MKKTTLIILGVLAGALALCLCACVGGSLLIRGTWSALQNAEITTPDGARAVAHSIIGYDLPAGYEETTATNLGFAKMVMILPANREDECLTVPVIVLYEVNLISDRFSEDILRQGKFSVGGDAFEESELINVESATVNVRGQDAPLIVYETTAGGTTLHEVRVGPFHGENGTVLILIYSLASQWDQGLADAFIASIR
jgi:hypothetical protein